MINKIKQVMKWAQTKLRPFSFSGGAMKYIVWYALLLVFCCTLYVWSWLADWRQAGRPDMPQLLNFIHEIASASWVAVIGFVAQAFVDKDNNGIPDEYEKDENEKDGNRNETH